VGAFPICLFLAILAASGGGFAQTQAPSDDPQRRAQIAEDLGKQKDVRNLPALQALLKDPERAVRAEATAAVVAIGTQHGLAPLIEAVRDPDPSIQILAVDGLVNFYYPGYVQSGWTSALKKVGSQIKSRFSQPDPAVIDPYVTVLPEVILAIRRVTVGGTSLEARALAARALGILRARSATTQLLEALRTKDSRVMLESLRALEKIGDPAAGPGIAPFLRDLYEPVQIAAIEATGQLQNREANPVLRDLLPASRKAAVRRAALIALAKMPEPPSREMFLSYLNDRDKYLRAAAAEGLGRMGEPEHRPALERAFAAEKSESPRLSMAFALVLLGDTTYLSYLVDALNSTFHRGEARPFLTELARRPSIISQLSQSVRGGSNEQKKNLAQVIALSGGADSLPLLQELSNDPNPEVAQEAMRAAKSLKARL